ncbi:hypothetical protein CPB85DRAFT_1368273, partial [Mucidula mucida]
MLCRYPWRREIAAIRHSQRISYSTRSPSDEDMEQRQKRQIHALKTWRSQIRLLFDMPGWESPPPRLLWVGGRLAVPAAGAIHDCLRATTLKPSRAHQAFNIISGLRLLRSNNEVRGQAHLVDLKPQTRWRVTEMLVELAITQKHKYQGATQKGELQRNGWLERALTLVKREAFTVYKAEEFVRKLVGEGKEFMAALVLVEALCRYRDSVLPLQGAFGALLLRATAPALGPETASRQQALLTICHLTSYLQKVGYPHGWNTSALIDAVWTLRGNTDLVWIVDPRTSVQTSEQVSVRWHMLTTLCRLEDETHLLTISPSTTLYLSLLIDLLDTRPPPSNTTAYPTSFSAKPEGFSVALEAEKLWKKCLFANLESTRDPKLLAVWIAQIRARFTRPSTRKLFDDIVGRVKALLDAVHKGDLPAASLVISSP